MIYSFDDKSDQNKYYFNVYDEKTPIMNVVFMKPT